MDFVTKSFRKDEILASWNTFTTYLTSLWAWLLNTIAITPKSEDKYVEKVFNWSEVHLSEMTCSKIHTLEKGQFCGCLCITVSMLTYMQYHFIRTIVIFVMLVYLIFDQILSISGPYVVLIFSGFFLNIKGQ